MRNRGALLSRARALSAPLMMNELYVVPFCTGCKGRGGGARKNSVLVSFSSCSGPLRSDLGSRLQAELDVKALAVPAGVFHEGLDG